jgi:predicted nicotinamide N-methyase
VDRPDAVAGRRVFDLGSGSGLCAVVAARAGAASVVAADIDPFAVAAIGLNARANRVRISTIHADVLEAAPPDADVVLAGDCWYEALLADRAIGWLRRARVAGADILVGDPGRRYLPARELRELAAYEVRTTTELEDLPLKTGRVFALDGPDAALATKPDASAGSPHNRDRAGGDGSLGGLTPGR